MKELNVLYTTDHNYVKYVITSMYSLLENNRDIKINIHLVNDGFTSRDFDLIDGIVSRFKNANIIYHSFDNIKSEIDKYNIPKWRNTNMSNARVFFSKEVKDIDNLLYLDSDTFVVGSLSNLDNYNGTVNMVEDVMPKHIINRLYDGIKYYCNSGVIYINMDKWIKEDCDKKLVDTLKSNIRLNFPDQDLINIALRDDIKVLPPEYNVFTTDYYYKEPFRSMYYKQSNIERYSKEEIEHAKKNPVILHGTPLCFTKEYTIEDSLHPYNKFYNEYLSRIHYTEIKGKKKPLDKLIMDTGLHTKVLVDFNTRQKIKKLIKRA